MDIWIGLLFGLITTMLDGPLPWMIWAGKERRAEEDIRQKILMKVKGCNMSKLLQRSKYVSGCRGKLIVYVSDHEG